MKERLIGSAIVFALMLAVVIAGCERAQEIFKTDESRFLAPERVINSEASGSPINPIYRAVGAADITQELVANATFPTDGDWEYTDRDYVIGPTDVLNINVLDLFQEGLETSLQREVSASGYIDLPLLDQRVKAEGFTASELQDEIADAYSPQVLLDPTVSVTVVARRQDTFSILGAIARPGQYNIVRKDMRLLEALAMAGGVTQANIRYIYVIRPRPAIRRRLEQPPRERPSRTERPGDLPELPGGDEAPQPPANGGVTLEEALEELGEAIDEPAETPVVMFNETAAGGDDIGELRRAGQARQPRFMFDPGTGEWVDVADQPGAAQTPGLQPPRAGTGEPLEEMAERTPETLPAGSPELRQPDMPPVHPGMQVADEPEEDPFGWTELDKSDLARIIAINLQKLRSGDQRMNIIVRGNDIIHVPTLEIGEFYVMGEVGRPGVYSLTGRHLTVKQALAAAGNMGALAWPENSILIRRIGDSQEQIIPLNVEAIFRGTEPDVFLKPNDVLAIGTNWKASFYAVIRNAFRMTYGFGFIYDRNFGSPYPGENTLERKRFTRW